MGAEFWQHQTPFQPDPEAAFRSLQAEVFRRAGYDLAKLLEERIEGMAEVARSCEHDDPYDLSEHYRDALQRLRRLAAQGVPEDVTAQIVLLREIEAVSSDNAPGVLGLAGVSEKRELRKVCRLTRQQIEQAFDTSTPSARDVEEGIDRLADSIDRGAALCFPTFENGRPVSWCFMGYSAD